MKRIQWAGCLGQEQQCMGEPQRWLPRTEQARQLAQREGYTLEQLRSRTKSQDIARARRAVMLELRALGHSSPEIASTLGRDPTTVLYHLRKGAA